MQAIIRHQKERISNLKAQLVYVQNALTHELEPWERKEYLAVEEQYKNEITNLQCAIEGC